MACRPATNTSSRSDVPSVEVHQLWEGEEAVAAPPEGPDYARNGGYGVGTVGLREGVGVLAVVQQRDAAGAKAVQYAALDDVRRRTVPVPRHHRPPYAPEAEFFGGRDDLGTVPAVRDAERSEEHTSEL